MSMCRCAKCGAVVDTDYDLNGIEGNLGYICESCTEDLADEPCARLNECGECITCRAREALA